MKLSHMHGDDMISTKSDYWKYPRIFVIVLLILINIGNKIVNIYDFHDLMLLQLIIQHPMEKLLLLSCFTKEESER